LSLCSTLDLYGEIYGELLMNDLPRISVVVATRNRAAYLERMLDRLFEDDYPDKEVIVVDGASTDGTVALLESYGEKITRWISEPDDGEYYAYNKAIAMTSGEIIKLMSDDDVLLPGVLQYAADYFRQHPDVVVLFGYSLIFDHRDGKEFLIQDTKQVAASGAITLRMLLVGTRLFNLSISAFIRADVLAEVGELDTELACGDVEMWARIASRGMKLAIADRHFVHYHITSDSGIERKRWQLAWDHWKVARRYGSTYEQVLVFGSRLLLPALLLPFQEAAHALGWHPLRMRAARRTRQVVTENQTNG